MFLEERVAAACAAIRLVPDRAEGLSMAIAACSEAAGMDGGVVIEHAGTGVRVVASHGIDVGVAEAFGSFCLPGSPLLPATSQCSIGPVPPERPDDADFLTFALERAGIRAHASFPLGQPGSAPGSVLCLLSRFASQPRGDALRRLGRVVGTVADAVARRNDSDAVALREASLRAIVDTVADGIVTVDGEGRITSANPAVGRVLGHPPDRLVGMHVRRFLTARGQRGLAGGFPAALRQGSGRPFGRPVELTAVHCNGTEVPIEVVVSEVEPGRLFTLVVRDITERRVAESKLRQSDRMASLGTLAAGLGHDMNNVLFPLRAHLNAIEADRSGEGAPGRAGHVASIASGIRYLQQLADGLHYLVHDAGHADGGQDGAVVEEWWKGTGPLLTRSLPPLTRVEVDISPGLPRVRITEHALTQAALNLFVNAGEAISGCRSGADGLVRLAVHAAPDGRSILLSVTDNGPGMDEETRRRAFDLFFTTKVRGLGTGLGLAMVSRVAREAGGEAWIESEPGRGASVTVRVPVAVDSAELSGVTVAVTGTDGRAVAFVEAALSARGARIAGEGELAAADAWFVDPRGTDPQAVRAWRRRRTGRTVVQLGLPHRVHRGAWSGAADCTVRSITDFDTLLAGVGLACSTIERRRSDGRNGNADGAGGDRRQDARPQEGDKPRDRARAGGGARARGR